MDDVEIPSVTTDDEDDDLSEEPMEHASLLEEVVRALVKNAAAVKITEERDEAGRGLTLRTVFRKIGLVDDHLRISLEIDDDRGRRRSRHRRRAPAAPEQGKE